MELSPVGRMPDIRYEVWLAKTSQKDIRIRIPKLQTLPWLKMWEKLIFKHISGGVSALAADPPKLDPTVYGWIKDRKTTALSPVTLHFDKLTTPAYMFKVICWRCLPDQSCTSTKSTYFVFHLPNTFYLSSSE